METVLHLQGNVNSTLTPLVLIHPISGLALPYLAFGELSEGGQRPIYGINSPIYTQRFYRMPYTLDELALSYVGLVRDLQPHGPYLLGGWSMGGMIAQRMAAILEAYNEEVIHVVLIDAMNPCSIPLFESAAEHQNLVTLTYNRLFESAGALNRPKLTSSVSFPGPPVNPDLSLKGKLHTLVSVTEIPSSSNSSLMSSNSTSQVNLASLSDSDDMLDLNYEEEDSDSATYSPYEHETISPLEILDRMLTHVTEGLALIADKSQSRLPSSISAPVSLFKCTVLDKLPASLSEARRLAVTENFADNNCGWRLPCLQTIPIKAAHDRVFDPKHVAELTIRLKTLLGSCP